MGLRSSGRAGLGASPFVMIDAIPGISVADPAAAFIGTHEQWTLADSSFTLLIYLWGHQWWCCLPGQGREHGLPGCL